MMREGIPKRRDRVSKTRKPPDNSNVDNEVGRGD